MISPTGNELKVLDYLVRHFTQRNSINQLAKRVGLSAPGAMKLLAKLESHNIVTAEKLSNAVYYRINFATAQAVKLIEFVLLQRNLNPYARVQAEDLEKLKGIAIACVLYGSVLAKGEDARDIDALLVLDDRTFEKDLASLQKALRDINSVKPKHIHDLVLTREDLVKNLAKGDEVVLEIIRTGQVLWGPEIIVEAIHGATGQPA